MQQNLHILAAAAVVAAVPTISFAQAAADAETLTVNVETAGTLPTLISADQKNAIGSLTLTGSLNGTDILFIREMAGRDKIGNETAGQLAHLDLADANIVAGGDAYVNVANNDHGTADNTISIYMFDKCKLQSIVLPKTITAIDGAFGSCYSLTGTFDIPEGVTRLGNYAFEACTQIEHFNVPTTVKAIGTWAFYGCHALKDFTFPEGVARVSGSTFYDCSALAEVTLPSTMAYISGAAFKNCTSLAAIHVRRTTPPTLDWGVFDDDAYENVTVYVPEGTVAAYREKDGWMDFKNIVEEGVSAIGSVRADAHAAADGIYTVSGQRVQPKDARHGLYIVVSGGKAQKIIKK